MRLKYQLFLTLLLSSIAVIALMAAFNSWSLNRGFSRYIVDNERRELSNVVSELESLYQQYGNWDWVSERPGELRSVLSSGRGRRVFGGDGAASQRSGRPPPRQRISLLNAQRQVLAGQENNLNKFSWLPIRLDDSEVGYLGFREPKGLPGELENIFLRQQMRSYIFAGIAIVVLSSLLAIALSGRIVKPLLSINRVVGRITGGDYTQRVDAHRRDELGDLSRHLNEMARTLEKNQTARRQWMAEISHELRTPVAILQGELEAIQDGVSSLDESSVESLHGETLRLSKLIDDLHELSLSDLGAMDYQMQETDFGVIFNERLATAGLLLEQAGLEISVSTSHSELPVRGDPGRFAQLIDNLIQNSAKYTDAGGRIDVDLVLDKACLNMTWSDSAPSVSDEQLPRIFDTLFRAEASRSRQLGGSGLGLSIVKRIVEAHSGTVSASQSDTGGLKLTFELPLRPG